MRTVRNVGLVALGLLVLLWLRAPGPGTPAGPMPPAVVDSSWIELLDALEDSWAGVVPPSPLPSREDATAVDE